MSSSKQSSKGSQQSVESDIVELIITDHELVREAFQKLKDMKGKPDAKEEMMEQIYQTMAWSIAEHAVAEELVFYPLLEKGLGKEGQKVTAESRVDHEKTKMAMGEVDGKPYKQVQEKVHKMMEDLLEHIEKEEREDLVVTREKFDKAQLKEAASLWMKAKMFAPQENATTNDKLPFESPFALMNAATDKLKELFEARLPKEGEDGEGEGGKRYNLRHHGEKEGGSQGDTQKAEKEDGGKSGGKNVTSPSKSGGKDGQKNGSPGKKDTGDDSVSPPAKRAAGEEDHASKKGVAASGAENGQASKE